MLGSGNMPLQSLTNSPVQSPQLQQKTRLSILSNSHLGSDRSEALGFADVDDGICDALRITSEQPSSLGSTCESQPGCDRVTYPRQGGQRDSSSETSPRIEHYAAEQSNRGTKAVKHRRGWSLNDLDCLIHIQPLLYDTSHRCSVTSVEALEAAGRATVYPHLPLGPPPLRKSTPDGIPSFGTFEAQRLRLVEPSWLHRLGKLIAVKLLRVDNPEAVAEDPAHSTNTDQIYHPTTQQTRYQNPVEMLRRASGMTRPTLVPATSVKLRRSSLPQGVRKASLPGDLAIAADGSHVRGRFGQRVSGHGVGQRTIDVHPLARRQGTSAVEEEVRAINKACDREIEREQYYATVASNDPQLLEDSLPQSHRRQHPDATGRWIPAPSLTSGGLVHQSPVAQRQDTEIHGALRTSPLPLYTHSSLLRHGTVLSRNQERHVDHPTQAEDGFRTNQLPGIASVNRNWMPEPAPYDRSHSQAVQSREDFTMPSAVEEIVDNAGRQHQLPAETDRTRNLRMEIEIC